MLFYQEGVFNREKLSVLKVLVLLAICQNNEHIIALGLGHV